ncbi:chemotaxis protein histidine kinase CheA [Bradyrhizobium sp. S3.14.4]
MDDLLREFLTETSESLDTVDNQLVKFEQEPNNAKILDNIFRLVHTIKGTCGFLGLPRLEALAHAGETLMGKFRDGMPVTGQAVTVILSSIDRIKEILAGLEATEAEPEGTDRDLIDKLEAMVEQGMAAMAAGSAAPVAEAPPLVPEAPAEAKAAPAKEMTQGSLIDQTLERPLRPGEVSLDELERAFRETAIEAPAPVAKAEPAPAAEAPAPAAKEAAKPAKEKAAPKKSMADEGAAEGDRIANQSIRVNVDTLEHLMTMVSELVLTRNQLLEISRRNEDTEFKVPLQRLSNVTAELQEGVMKTRMQPIGNAWQKLPRIVRDLSSELGKQIELEMHGADTELDRQVLDLIKDPLTHMVRNSADHGLETPAERLASGKGEQGTIRLSAYHEGGHIIICIADNGRGLNTERIKAKAISSGLVTEAELEKMSEAQIHKFIFAPGFSTAAAITSVSGRGVGMDVVRTNIDQIGGTIDIKSVAGEGSSVTIKIPLTLAIVIGADRRGRRRPLRDPAALGGRARPCPRQQRAPHRAYQGHRRPAPAQQAAAADPPQEALEDRRRRGLRSRERLYRRDPGRQPDLWHRRRRRVPHRRDRGQADVDEAASHRHVLRQHHSGRWRCYHDHRSQRHCQGARRRRLLGP